MNKTFTLTIGLLCVFPAAQATTPMKISNNGDELLSNAISMRPRQKPTKTTVHRYLSFERDVERNKYYLPDIDFTSIEQVTGPYTRAWQMDNGFVKVTKWASGAFETRWDIGSTSIILVKQASGAIEQTWRFHNGDVYINIMKHASGAIDEFWFIADRSYEYHKHASGMVEADNDVPVKYRAKYEREIKLWCIVNGRFFPLTDCMI